jgi:hypothetical protein
MIGCRQPNSRMDAATLSTAAGGILRALRAYGVILSNAHKVTFIGDSLHMHLVVPQ